MTIDTIPCPICDNTYDEQWEVAVQTRDWQTCDFLSEAIEACPNKDSHPAWEDDDDD